MSQHWDALITAAIVTAGFVAVLLLLGRSHNRQVDRIRLLHRARLRRLRGRYARQLGLPEPGSAGDPVELFAEQPIPLYPNPYLPVWTDAPDAVNAVFDDVMRTAFIEES